MIVLYNVVYLEMPTDPCVHAHGMSATMRRIHVHMHACHDYTHAHSTCNLTRHALEHDNRSGPSSGNSEGDIRLQDCMRNVGPDQDCCRLEFKHNDEWGTVCADSSSDLSDIALVACR